MADVIAALDIGTTKVCAMVAEIEDEDTLVVLGVGEAPTRGMRHGAVVNVHDVTMSVQEAVTQAERASNVRIANAFVGLSALHVEVMASRGTATISPRGSRSITLSDMHRALETAGVVRLPPNREVVQVLPRTYKVDEQEGIRDPLGMEGFRLEVDALVLSAPTVTVQNLIKCVKATGIEVDDLVIQPIASGLAVLTQEEQELGVVVMDIGCGTTDVAIFMEGVPWYVAGIPVAGHYLTQDVAITLRMPMADAEDLKLRYGHAQSQWVSEDETITIGGFGDSSRRVISRHLLSEILQARAEEILDLAWQEVKSTGYDTLLPAGVVLTGGSALLPGFRDLAREYLQMPVRVGRLPPVKGLDEEHRSPVYATALGLLVWGQKHPTRLGFEEQAQKNEGTLWARFSEWFKRLLPAM